MAPERAVAAQLSLLVDVQSQETEPADAVRLQRINTSSQETDAAAAGSLLLQQMPFSHRCQDASPCPNLERFVTAQARHYAIALAEVLAGRKQSCWVWFVFPQFLDPARAGSLNNRT